ncbi:MAG TPA: alpha/beta fold hydrolase [Methanotrichaceae archaeon]|nr:alpha/beta fold hydrolase [Methanotrichaceae archaeon]
MRICLVASILCSGLCAEASSQEGQADYSDLAFSRFDLPSPSSFFATDQNFIVGGGDAASQPSKDISYYISDSELLSLQYYYTSSFYREVKSTHDYVFNYKNYEDTQVIKTEDLITVLFVFNDVPNATSYYNGMKAKILQEVSQPPPQGVELLGETYGDESTCILATTPFFAGGNQKRLVAIFRIRNAVAIFTVLKWFEGVPAEYKGEDGNDVKIEQTEVLGNLLNCRDFGQRALRSWSERLSRELPLIPTVASVSVEVNPATNKPYRGLAADGVSNLRIDLNFPHLKKGLIVIKKPALGRFEGDTLNANGEVGLDGLGRATVVYYPPDYLKSADLNGRIELIHGSDAPPVRGAQVPLDFVYRDAENKECRQTLEITAYRPPVLLIHGIFGDKTTWKKLDEYLHDKGFDSSVDEYYSGDESIEALAEHLGENIADQINDYSASDIKLAKVDSVGHSLGGLISRYYAKSDHGNLRKVIMVATPNHGVSYVYRTIGKGYSLFMTWSAHHKRAAEELYYKSKFIEELNLNEKQCGHLNPEVQYGNIYCHYNSYVFKDNEFAQELMKERTQPYRPQAPLVSTMTRDELYHSIDSGAQTDGIVSSASAHLNGVEAFTINDVSHSSSLPASWYGPSITESSEMMNKVEQWLTGEIPSRVRWTYAEAFDGQGKAYQQMQNGEKKEITAYPVELNRLDSISTDEGGKASVRLIQMVGSARSVFGLICLDSNSEMCLNFVSPINVEIQMKRGNARFICYGQKGSYSIDIGREGDKIYDFEPRALVQHLNTDFVVSVGDDVRIYSLNGTMIIRNFQQNETVFTEALTDGQGAILNANGSAREVGLPQERWWSDQFYSSSAQSSSNYSGSAPTSSSNVSAERIPSNRITVGGSGSDYSRIQDAINASKGGGVIEIQSGIYREAVNVTKPLIIKGRSAGSQMPVIDPGMGYYGLTLSSDGTSIEGLAVRNSSAGVFCAKCSGITIKNVTSEYNLYGIYLDGTVGSKLIDNDLSHNQWGVVLRDSSNNTLVGNVVKDNNVFGIFLFGTSSKNWLSRNILAGNLQSDARDMGIDNHWDGESKGDNYSNRLLDNLE